MKTKRKRFSSTGTPLLLLSAFTIVSLLLSGCAFPSNGNSVSNQDSSSPVIENSQVEVDFSLQLPAALGQGERIEIEILDEVTGLPYNAFQYEMSEVSQQQYTITLSFTEGSVVKYRYIKVSDAIKTEAALDGQPIRYRMYYAAQAGSVTDILHSWEDEKRDAAVGTLSGTVLDKENAQPIPDILISAGGQLTLTDANGQFFIENVSPGVHNIVFYAIDGKYRTYQQGASVSAGLNTPAEVALNAMPLTKITFIVNAPSDALGAPIYLAGNLAQFGNTFSDLEGGMSIHPKRMPQLTRQDDGTYLINLQLYAGTDLRYKFTLGDGYWNAEQQTSGGFRIRQLIVPSEDLMLDMTIDSWRIADIEPITFSFSIPTDTSPFDEKFIQFKTSRWTQPLPLWPLGNGNYLYILFSPLDDSLPVYYRLCRNENCDAAKNLSTTTDQVVQPSSTPQTVAETISAWENWLQFEQEVYSANIPWKGEDFQTSIEVTPEMDPSWQVYAPIGVAQLADGGVENIIFSPLWFIQSGSPYIRPEIGSTPSYDELCSWLNASQSVGFLISIFPQLGSLNEIETWWVSQSHDDDWWQNWFDSYERFILNYTKLAENCGASALILGGKSVLPAIPGGVYPDGSDTDVPEAVADRWQDLITHIKAIYTGKLVWGTNVHTDADPLPPFIDEFDEIYVSVDSPLAQDTQPSLEGISSSFNSIIDNFIYEIYRSTLKPITIGLAYPSADGASQGCDLLVNQCYNDGLFLPGEVSTASVDLEEQTLIYNAIMPVIASREWITGISIRGYDPTVVLHDASSSVSGKPAWDVIQHWFSGLNAQ